MTKRTKLLPVALASVLVAGLAVALMQPAAAQKKSKGSLNKDWGNCSIQHCDKGK